MDSKGESSVTEPPAEETSPASKPRLKKPLKPDVEEHKAAVEQLQSEMAKRKTRMEEIKQAIEQKRNFDGGPEFQQARSKLNQLSASFKAQLVPQFLPPVIASRQPRDKVLAAKSWILQSVKTCDSFFNGIRLEATSDVAVLPHVSERIQTRKLELLKHRIFKIQLLRLA